MTKVLRGKAAAKVDGLKKGERVAVESAEKDGTLFAASVKVGGEPTTQAYVCPMHPEVTSKEPGALPEVQDVPGAGGQGAMNRYNGALHQEAQTPGVGPESDMEYLKS